MRSIKQLTALAVVAALALAASRAPAQNQNITLDEWGNGTYNGSPLTWSFGTDPISGMTTLMYNLPFQVIRGDFVITEGLVPPVTSDVIRFDNTSVGPVAYFFSDLPDESPVPLADKGLPPPTPFPFVTLAELGTEGNNGVTYTTATGDPGTALIGGNQQPVTYTIISDSQAVPEPSTLALLGACGVGLAVVGWRRRKCATGAVAGQPAAVRLGTIALLGLLALAAGSVSAQNILFDEWGNGTSSGGTLSSSITLDPLSGTPTLTYQLPFRVMPGDLVLTENTTAGTVYSDLIRFDNSPIGGLAYFFSDPPDETPAPPADVGLPPLIAAQPTIFLGEQGPEGNNGVFYIPGPSDPGYPTNGTTATYTIISDSKAVPEPSTLALMGSAGIGLLGFVWRKRKSSPA